MTTTTQSSGTLKSKKQSYTIGGVDREEVISKLKQYNDYYAGKTGHGQLECGEEDGRLVIAGLLRLHWRVNKQIQFKPKDDVPILQKPDRLFRKSYMMAIDNGFDVAGPKPFPLDGQPASLNGGAPPTRQEAVTPPRRDRTASTDDDVIVLREKPRSTEVRRFHTVCYKGEKNKRKRFSINGHFYDGETSCFTPAHGTVTTVRVTSLDNTTQVIQALLDKFKVENKADEFCLIQAKRNGEMNRLMMADYPLLERVLLGPHEEEAKIIIMDSHTVNQMSYDINQYVSLPEAVLRGFLGKLTQEETEAMERIRARFARYRDKLESRLQEMVNDDLQQSET